MDPQDYIAKAVTIVPFLIKWVLLSLPAVNGEIKGLAQGHTIISTESEFELRPI